MKTLYIINKVYDMHPSPRIHKKDKTLISIVVLVQVTLHREKNIAYHIFIILDYNTCRTLLVFKLYHSFMNFKGDMSDLLISYLSAIY